MSNTTDKILEEAKKALSGLTEEQKTEAVNVRYRVYEWLESVAHGCADSSSIVTKEAVDDDESRKVVKGVLKTLFPSAYLVSRQSSDKFWISTSFVYDPDTLTLNAKIGDNHYQPFAFDDGVHLVQTETAKLLWSRMWAMAIAADMAPPFDISINHSRLDFSAEAGFIDQDNMERLKKSFSELQDEMGLYLNADKRKMEEAEYRLRETLKLARIWSPILDAKLKTVLRVKGGLGPNFENADIKEVVKASLEFMAARMDANTALIKTAQTELTLSQDTAESRNSQVTLCKQLRICLTSETVNKEELEKLLDRTKSVCSLPASLQESIVKEPDAIIKATLLYNWLAPRLSIDAPIVTAVGSGDTAAPAPAATDASVPPASDDTAQSGRAGVHPDANCSPIAGPDVAGEDRKD